MLFVKFHPAWHRKTAISILPAIRKHWIFETLVNDWQASENDFVSHQHRYGKHYQKVKEIIASGALGRVHTVYGSATGWMTHMLSHLIDYTCWLNDYTPANWAMAQAAGRAKLGDNHPSPDYIAGFVQFANGVRGIYECGAGAPDQPEVAKSLFEKDH
jgi:predicted dehydrogenase